MLSLDSFPDVHVEYIPWTCETSHLVLTKILRHQTEGNQVIDSLREELSHSFFSPEVKNSSSCGKTTGTPHVESLHSLVAPREMEAVAQDTPPSKYSIV